MNMNLTDIGKKYGLDISLNGKHDMLCELTLLMHDEAGGKGLQYVQSVIDNLELVLSEDKECTEFGYDATIIDFFKDKTIINYNYFEDQLEISSSDMYNLMKDWRDALIK